MSRFEDRERAEWEDWWNSLISDRPHSELRRAIEQSRAKYAFPDIEKRYPGTLLSGFLLKDAIALEEQYEAMDDALREILDVTEKWTRRMTDEERLLRIDTIAKAALDLPSPATVPDEPCLDCTHDYCRCKERASFAWRSNERSDT